MTIATRVGSGCTFSFTPANSETSRIDELYSVEGDATITSVSDDPNGHRHDITLHGTFSPDQTFRCTLGVAGGNPSYDFNIKVRS